MIRKLEFGKDDTTFEMVYIVNDRYKIYPDGVIYDTVAGKDIPIEIFDLRDILIKYYKGKKTYKRGKNEIQKL